MSWFSATFTCGRCSLHWEDLIPRSQKDEEHPCPNCAAGVTRNFEVGHHTRASYVDGNNRFRDAKEAAKLNKEMAQTSPSNRKEIAGEIKKLGYKFDK